MKFFLVCILAVCIFSCKEKASTPASRPKLVNNDSPIIKSDIINPYAPVDVSPMDISYFPVDYPIESMYGRIPEPLVARVIYSRPHRQGRTVFGGLLKFGEPWRLGANEATEIEFFVPVTIDGRRLNKGRYTMYVIPFDGRWTIVFNSNLDVWGLTPNPSKDVLKVDVNVEVTSQHVEYFSMVFQDAAKGADLIMAWDTIVAKLPIEIN
ncbi:MAG: DUF2911 domain-containing protein [Flavisolibacter sp.]|jgi:hypothetical protein|nr:DUF2911 domain-containing protein [Flavisolibacter sp.]